MNLGELTHLNKTTVEKVEEFRQTSSLDVQNPLNAVFHSFKNQYPFFGFIEVVIDDCAPFLMYSNNDDLIAMSYFWHGPNAYERQSIKEWVSRVQGKTTIFDVGSFSGVYSLAAACSAKREKEVAIHAFEPTRRVQSRLLTNIQVNSFSQTIQLAEYAASNSVNLVNFFQYRASNVLGAGASFINKGKVATSSNEIAQAVPLDWFAEANNVLPELMKIDVEQAEVMALQGMRNILDSAKPDILIEVSPSTAPEVAKILRAHGYKLYEVNEEKQSLVPFAIENIGKVLNVLAEC